MLQITTELLFFEQRSRLLLDWQLFGVSGRRSARPQKQRRTLGQLPHRARQVIQKQVIVNGRMKRRVHEILEIGQSGDRLSKGADLALMALIMANVAAIIVGTDAGVHSTSRTFFYYFEMVSFSIFAGEYLLRVWSCTSDPRYAHPVRGRLRYALHPLMLADATAVFSYFIILFLPTGLDLGVLRTLRLVSRLISLARYSAGMQAVVSVAAARKSELLAVVSVVGALLVMASSLMYLVEHAAQPEKFSSIPETMWWSVITVTTVGYGDVAPITTIGRILAGFIALLGVAIFALPAGILGSGFTEHVQRDRFHSHATCHQCGADLNGAAQPQATPAPAPVPRWSASCRPRNREGRTALNRHRG